MRFQKKLLIHYVVFFAVSVTSVFLVYVYSSRKRYGSMEYARLQVMAGQMVQQMDLQYSSMEMAGEAILSDGELLEALRILKTVPEGSVYREEAKKQVTVRLNAYYLVKRYYRALIYSDAGDVFASYDFDSRKVVDRRPGDRDGGRIRPARRRGGWSLFRPVRICGGFTTDGGPTAWSEALSDTGRIWRCSRQRKV